MGLNRPLANIEISTAFLWPNYPGCESRLRKKQMEKQANKQTKINNK